MDIIVLNINNNINITRRFKFKFKDYIQSFNRKHEDSPNNRPSSPFFSLFFPEMSFTFVSFGQSFLLTKKTLIDLLK